MRSLRDTIAFIRMIAAGLVVVAFAASLIVTSGGCQKPPPPYGREASLTLPGIRRQVWAVAPAINLSGQREVDPLLQADLAYQQCQQINGLTVIPVNRVVEVYAGLRIERIQTQEQATAVCEILGCDALVIPTITAFDPYEPPKFGGSLQLFRGPRFIAPPEEAEAEEAAAAAAAARANGAKVKPATFLQAVGMFDASNGSVRDAVLDYAKGRHDPLGPMGTKEYFVSMDRYCGFAYHALLHDLLTEMQAGR